MRDHISDQERETILSSLERFRHGKTSLRIRIHLVRKFDLHRDLADEMARELMVR